jgi:hypothetical protein
MKVPYTESSGVKARVQAERLGYNLQQRGKEPVEPLPIPFLTVYFVV